LGHRPAREWVKDQLQRVIEEFEIDWLKHDFDLITVCQAENHTHTPGDGRIAACAGFYEIMDFVRSKYPQVLCENWMNDSAVPDYGVLQRHHVQLIGDAYKAFLLRQMFYGHCQIFPPDRQHRYLRLEDSEGDLTTMLRSGSMGGPWTLLSDPRLLSSEQLEILTREIRFYKQHRHLLAGAKVYRLIGRPHPRGWDAFEFYDPKQLEGIVYVFRNKHPEASKYVPLKGLREDTTYRIGWADGRRSMNLSGRQLSTQGLLVELPQPGTSEVLLVSRKS
jgi:alpha-galactosidase